MGADVDVSGAFGAFLGEGFDAVYEGDIDFEVGEFVFGDGGEAKVFGGGGACDVSEDKADAGALGAGPLTFTGAHDAADKGDEYAVGVCFVESGGEATKEGFAADGGFDGGTGVDEEGECFLFVEVNTRCDGEGINAFLEDAVGDGILVGIGGQRRGDDAGFFEGLFEIEIEIDAVF